MKLKTKVTQTITMSEDDMQSLGNIIHEALINPGNNPPTDVEAKAGNEFLRLIEGANRARFSE